MINEEVQIELRDYLHDKNIKEFEFIYYKKDDYYEFCLFKKQSCPISTDTNFSQLKLFIDKAYNVHINGLNPCPICCEKIISGIGCSRCFEYCCAKCVITICIKNNGKLECPICRFMPGINKPDTPFEVVQMYKRNLEKIKDWKNFNFSDFVDGKIG